MSLIEDLKSPEFLIEAIAQVLTKPVNQQLLKNAYIAAYKGRDNSIKTTEELELIENNVVLSTPEDLVYKEFSCKEIIEILNYPKALNSVAFGRALSSFSGVVKGRKNNIATYRVKSIIPFNERTKLEEDSSLYGKLINKNIVFEKTKTKQMALTPKEILKLLLLPTKKDSVAAMRQALTGAEFQTYKKDKTKYLVSFLYKLDDGKTRVFSFDNEVKFKNK